MKFRYYFRLIYIKRCMFKSGNVLSLSLPFSLPPPLKVMMAPGAKLGGSVHSWARRQELKTQDGGFSRDTETKLV